MTWTGRVQPPIRRGLRISLSVSWE